MVNIYCNKELEKTLFNNDVNEYAPAYNSESAGLDLYNASDDVVIMPQDFGYRGELIKTGLHVLVPKGYVAIVKERGSITKTPLKCRAGVVDSGYTGEIFVNLVNISNQEFTIKKDGKLPVQLVVVKCDNEFDVIDEEEYLKLSLSSSRKAGKIGSSD
jgi:deoxyuridine 5'-triphosphate nucleotidohydrolase